MQILAITPNEYPELLSVWESSVRATHDFLSEDDIQFYKSKMLSDFFPAVSLQCAKDNQTKICGFIGLSGDNIEMLFIAPEHRGLGIGCMLLNDAITHHQASKVDVNKQNTQAIRFYERMGFKIISRSELDGMGKRFPILHMQLSA
ncbi:acetyltransferase [Iodobacter sp. CM08]|uniref:acetyltransferase n=1 Tax=Iodobacter sp. CM08 TaxID=3085902 RepID=UPI002981E1B6|nr:acetyltransferase [Iodobacter sp. CM08]MDW5416838.1 acetyltransferase [Iodobacter sp. CM08]